MEKSSGSHAKIVYAIIWHAIKIIAQIDLFPMENYDDVLKKLLLYYASQTSVFIK